MNESASIFTVSEVTLHLKQVIESQLESFYISGEISNYLQHSSGHIYFNLKDELAVLRCSFFRNQNYQLDFIPQNGMQVICFGKLTVYEKSGQYQLIVNSMKIYGEGILNQRFEILKKKLNAEGLFDQQYKKAIPKYPDNIGIVTSPSGAALQDIINIIRRRYPAKLIVYPSLVQGNDAPVQVIEGLKYFNRENNVDVIIIARGGGSQEDLFCFNDEQLARQMFASQIPVISAIGHEIDFTIADFVADLRAPTPSAAAELVVPDKSEIEKHLSNVIIQLNMSTERKLSKTRNDLQIAINVLMQSQPERIWQNLQQRFDEATQQLLLFPERFKRVLLEYNDVKLRFQHTQFSVLSPIIKDFTHHLTNLNKDLHNSITLYITNLKSSLTNKSVELKQYSPTQILGLGYALIKKNNHSLSSISAFDIGDVVNITMHDGNKDVRITDPK